MYVRQFLEAEFTDINEFNLERVIDDFVFLCFLVGNDFLPHLPGLDIRNGGIDCLMAIYKNVVNDKGYFTDKKDICQSNFYFFIIQRKIGDIFRTTCHV